MQRIRFDMMGNDAKLQGRFARMEHHDSHPFRAGCIFAGAIGALAGAWWLRHLTARAVRAWRPGRGKFVPTGRLVTRVAGSGEPVFVLLHGLVASGETFGSAYDSLADAGTLVVPDLLGFSRSMDREREDFTLDDHLNALDEMMATLGFSKARLVVGGHSFGGLLTLHWAARHAGRVDRVVTWGAPLFRNDEEGRERLGEMGMLERLFAQDSKLARKSCEVMCAFRQAAGWLAIALSPDLPVAVSRRAVLHTWPAYRGALEIFFDDWQRALARLAEEKVPIRLVAGTEDQSQVPGLREQLARDYANIETRTIPDAAHIITLTHPASCAKDMQLKRV
ncbi:MAG: alpha/beta fold hydrolase [Chthoniobacterales bacterium]